MYEPSKSSPSLCERGLRLLYSAFFHIGACCMLARTPTAAALPQDDDPSAMPPSRDCMIFESEIEAPLSPLLLPPARMPLETLPSIPRRTWTDASLLLDPS